MNPPDPEASPPACLPLELLLQILARLPTKSLLRFKSVSKSLSLLTSDPHFIRLHLRLSPNTNHHLLLHLHLQPPNNNNNNNNNLILLSPSSSSSPSHLSLGFLPHPLQIKIRASHLGLLCCAISLSKGVYFVCNPLTQQFRLLPRARDRPFTRFQPEYEATLVGLAVHDNNNNNASSTGTYFNVVLAGFYRPFGHRPKDQLVCMVYDSITNSWTKFVHHLHEEFTHMNRSQSVVSNGAVHWLTSGGEYQYVIGLDLGEWVWRKISMPEEEWVGRIYLLEFEGLMSLVGMSGEWMSIWVLRDYARERWVLEDRVSLRCIRELAASAFPVSQTRDLVFLVTQKKVLTYGRRDKVWKEVYAVGDDCTYPLWFSAFSFRSTLLPCN